MNHFVKKRGLKIKRLYTAGLKHRYEGIIFEKRTSKITELDGSVVSIVEEVEVPNFWSAVATDILAQKYLRKTDVPLKDSQGNLLKDAQGNIVLGSEKSAKEAIDRLVKAWRWWGEEYGYFDTKEDADAFEDELAYMLMHQIASPNSPQWFNTGLALSYGIKGSPQGHWYVDPTTKEVKESQDAYTRVQAHACFILGIKDDLLDEGGIFSTLATEARIFKYGSGCGSNFSSLRSSKEPLSGGGQASGLMSFLKIFDAAAGSIKSGGTTRRAAKMVCVDVDHPEIEEFIEWKVKEERKVASLVSGSQKAKEILTQIMKSAQQKGMDPRQNPELKSLIKRAKENQIPLNYIKRVLMLVENGISPDEFVYEAYDTDFRSEAYYTVSGQNANNSIRITNDFIERVLTDREWNLIRRTDKKVSKTVKAKDLWKKIVRAAWESADPGLQYDTTINEWHTCPKGGRINASNPCSEYMFLDDTACNLASLNLIKFYDEKTDTFNVDEFKHAVRLWTIVLEITVLMSHLPNRNIAIKTFEYRTLGLGYGNLGALLMRMGIPYESEKGYAITATITALMTGTAYATSAEMASILGTFEKYEENKEDMLRVIRNHRRAIYASPEEEYEGLFIKPMKINYDLIPDYLVKSAREAWDAALELGTLYGYRNAQVTAIAPTGTIGLLMDFDTTGLEPDFSLVKFKKLVGGGTIKIVNQSIPHALRRLGYSESQIQEIEKYILGHGSLKHSPHINFETLKQKGFSQEKINEIELKIPLAYDIHNLFSLQNIGEAYVINELKLNLGEVNNKGGSILKTLGFSDEEIQAAQDHIFGTMSIEGAPHIKSEHLPIFDCANKCGNGTRFISPLGHVKQMAAAQPFISGAISKTVNLPADATIKDVEEIYLQGWKLMLKAIAIYRDGSKLSQPLYTINPEDKYYELLSNQEENNIDTKTVQQISEAQFKRPIRKRMPPERHSITHKFEVAGYEGYITVGLFEDGQPGEIFIRMSTAGSFLAGIMDALAISLSMNLQYGVPLETIIRNLSNLRFEPSGMTANPEIPIAKSIIDYIARWLAIKFLPRDLAKLHHNDELVDKSYAPGGSNSRLKIPIINVDTPEVNANTRTTQETNNRINNNFHNHFKEANGNSNNTITMNNNGSLELTSRKTLIQKAKSLGFTGEICQCGSMNVKKAGSCSVCMECGNTTGCS